MKSIFFKLILLNHVGSLKRSVIMRILEGSLVNTYLFVCSQNRSCLF